MKSVISKKEINNLLSKDPINALFNKSKISLGKKKILTLKFLKRSKKLRTKLLMPKLVLKNIIYKNKRNMNYLIVPIKKLHI